MTAEVKELLAQLEHYRAGVLKKLAGLSEADARRSTVPSGTNVAGLLQHLTFVESMWFGEVAGGRKPKGVRSMQVDDAMTLRQLRADYKAACAESNAIIAEIGDGDATVKHKKKQWTLRFVMLVVIGETARHAGHADIIREQVDGKTGR